MSHQPPKDPNGPLDVEDIQKILPHRYPFLLVDRILESGPDHVVGVKNVTANEAFFQGHFPQRKVMPGVLIIEAMAQTGGIVGMRRPGRAGKLAFLAGVDEARFKKPVVPGDTLVMTCRLVKEKAHLMFAECEAKVDGQVVCSAKIIFAFVE